MQLKYEIAYPKYDGPNPPGTHTHEPTISSTKGFQKIPEQEDGFAVSQLFDFQSHINRLRKISASKTAKLNTWIA